MISKSEDIFFLVVLNFKKGLSSFRVVENEVEPKIKTLIDGYINK